MSAAAAAAAVLAALAAVVAVPGRSPLHRVRSDAVAPRRPRTPRAMSGRSEAATRGHLDGLLGAFAAELRAGAAPRAALAGAADGPPCFSALVVAARHPAGDVVRALRDLAERPGGGSASRLAAVWQLGEQTGCSLAGPVSRLAVAHRDDEQVRREVAAQLAGPVATARLLSGLPVVGVLLGHGLGADPLEFLLGTTPGRVCLGAAALLLVAGIRWTTALARSP